MAAGEGIRVHRVGRAAVQGVGGALKGKGLQLEQILDGAEDIELLIGMPATLGSVASAADGTHLHILYGAHCAVLPEKPNQGDIAEPVVVIRLEQYPEGQRGDLRLLKVDGKSLRAMDRMVENVVQGLVDGGSPCGDLQRMGDGGLYDELHPAVPAGTGPLLAGAAHGVKDMDRIPAICGGRGDDLHA